MDHVLINLGFNITHSKFDRRFRSTFGVSYYLANIVAQKIAGTTVIPVYLLLALHFLKNYNTENVMSVFFNLDEKTIRKWVRIYVQYICEINAINFSDRYLNVPAGKKILVSVDGVDCPYKENSRPVDPGYCSHKLKRSALRYEVGVALYSSRICWIGGGVPAGRYNDLTISRMRGGILSHMNTDEKGMADNGYDGESKYITPIRGSGLTNNEKMYNRWVRTGLARHENINKRLKQYKVLNTVFRHDEEFHNKCFMACAVLTQLSMYQEPIFNIY